MLTLLTLFPAIDAPSLHSVDDEPSMCRVYFYGTRNRSMEACAKF